MQALHVASLFRFRLMRAEVDAEGARYPREAASSLVPGREFGPLQSGQHLLAHGELIGGERDDDGRRARVAFEDALVGVEIGVVGVAVVLIGSSSKSIPVRPALLNAV